MKQYKLYVKTDCGYCKQAVELLSIREQKFVVTVVDKNPDYLEQKKQKYQWQTTPIVLVSEDGNDETLLGGYTELAESLNVEFANEQSSM